MTSWARCAMRKPGRVGDSHRWDRDDEYMSKAHEAVHGDEEWVAIPSTPVVSDSAPERREPRDGRWSKPGTELDTSPPKPLLLDRLDPIEGSILFGPGGVGKGALACHYITGLTADGYTVLILDFEDHEGEWGRRLTGLGARMEGVNWFAPFRDGFGALFEDATIEAIRHEVEVTGADYLIIDSIVVACAGHDVADPKTPGLYAKALQAIGLPSLSLAHVTKLHDPRYPFGSAFWHNLARVTWSLMEKGGDVLLQNRKASNYRRQSAYTVEYTWWAPDPKPGQPRQPETLREVRETAASITLMERIVEAITEAGQPLSVSDIADAINEGLPKPEHTSPETLRATLSRALKKRDSCPVTKVGENWALKGDDE